MAVWFFNTSEFDSYTNIELTATDSIRVTLHVFSVVDGSLFRTVIVKIRSNITLKCYLFASGIQVTLI